MPETRVSPALTAEEWKDALAHRELALRMMGVPDGAVLTNAHRRAALALYQQPFGFTREDVALLDELVRGLDYEPERGDETAILDVMLRPEQAERLRPLAEKIRALLPP